MKALVTALFVLLPLFAQAQDSDSTVPETSTTLTAPAQSTPANLALDNDDDDETPVVKSTTSVSSDKKFPEFKFKSYGYISFGQKETFKTIQNLTPYERREIDLAEIAFEGEFELNDSAKVEFEVEIEHGGVGTAIEFDPFEEFGEFEQEIEKGGEVVLAEFFYKKDFKKTNTSLRVGKFPLFIALGSVMGKPHRNPSIKVSDLEERMIPLGWNETGVQLEQKLFGLTGRLGLVNGLNSEFFRTYSWVGGGYQRHFETMNADDLATLVSLEWGSVARTRGVAVSFYSGNSTGNRYKVDKVKSDAEVRILTMMGGYKIAGVGLLGELIQGELNNSDVISAANATLAGLAKPKAFAPLGHKARLQSLQLSYDVTNDLTFFVKEEKVNTFEAVEGQIFKNPRYDVERKSAGLMWMFDTAAFIKAQYAREKTKLENLPETYQANIAFGFDLDAFNK